MGTAPNQFNGTPRDFLGVSCWDGSWPKMGRGCNIMTRQISLFAETASLLVKRYDLARFSLDTLTLVDQTAGQSATFTREANVDPIQ